ncbi:unnamed protein product [Ranitomeya imitator]|uniref:Uncharacterized protein n=1 Tax=Ranitomeya imitator TaxID=111125 RepID=A0ABN9M011_9NEOB|nr:unnamed protein product [Ranitomeya imitator]
MKVSTLLLISIQVFLATAGRSRGNKEPEITSIACNDPAAEAVADLSLRQLNANRREGSVLGLKRISNVQQQFDVNSTNRQPFSFESAPLGPCRDVAVTSRLLIGRASGHMGGRATNHKPRRHRDVTARS